MAAVVVPISGPYVGAWNAKPFGTLNDDGYELRCTVAGQSIDHTDAYGMTLVEAIHRGQNWHCLLRGLEWKTGLTDSLQMFGQQGAAGSLTPTLLNIGARWSTFCQALVLTAILANPPTTPQSLTATQAGLAPGQTSSFHLTSKMRELPLDFVFLPYSVVISSVTYVVPFVSS